MAGANIFVVYTSGNGNVTLSPRLGTGHFMPEFNRDAQVTLLEGSGVSGGKIIANVRCEYSPSIVSRLILLSTRFKLQQMVRRFRKLLRKQRKLVICDEKIGRCPGYYITVCEH